jgi:2-hydroxychromene-2-carboxylate isomerase
MVPQVQFLFDFGSPNSYLAGQVIPQIEARTGAPFTYVPVLLGGIFKLTNNSSPVQAFSGVKNKLDYMTLETRRFVRKHNIAAFKWNPHFPVNTLLLMRAAVAADMDGILKPYYAAAAHNMWEDPKKMDDPGIFRAAMDASGLDGGRLLERAQDSDVKARLMEQTQNAVDRGVFGCPSFFVGAELFFGKDQLRDAEDEIEAQKRA